MSFLDAVRDLLSAEFNAIVMVGDAQSLRVGAARLQPSMIVVDLALGDGEGLRLLERLRADSPGSQLVVLTFYSEPAVAEAAMAAGASGIVLKRSVAPDLLECVDCIRAGGVFVSPALVPGAAGAPGAAAAQWSEP